jgi:N-acetylglucosamine repressor
MVFINTKKEPANEGKNQSQGYKRLLLKKQIVEIFYSLGSQTIADVCELTYSSTPSITNIMAELTKEGWLKKLGIGDSKGGRKPAIFGLNSRAGYLAAIDLSRRDSRLGVFNLLNQKVGEVVEVSEGLDTTDDILAVLWAELNYLLKSNNISKKDVLGLGVAVPGLIDIKSGVSYSYPLFENQPIEKVFERKFGYLTVVEHDTKSMALGEAWFGMAREKSNVLFVNIGSGIGLGIIINGQLYHGQSGFSGEFGHIQMDPEGKLCYCGKIGCLETIASGTALVKKAREQIDRGKHSMISNMAGGKLNDIKFKTIIDAAHQGDHFAIELLEDAGEYLAKGMSVLLHLFNPEAIIIGGEMAEAGSLIKDAVRQKLNKYAMLRLKDDTRLLLSDLKKEAGLYGLLPICANKVFEKHFTP